MIEDDDIWQEEAKTIKPLKKIKPVMTSTPVVKKPVIRERAFQEPKTEPGKRASGSIPQKRIKQLKQQKIPIEATLDLHGMTMIRAHDAVQRFILSAWKNEYRCIEVITGIGKLEGTGQLKRFFPLWIQEPSLNQYILHLEINPVSRGGSYLVLLRRNKFRD